MENGENSISLNFITICNLRKYYYGDEIMMFSGDKKCTQKFNWKTCREVITGET
jgi:hypothetical protein